MSTDKPKFLDCCDGIGYHKHDCQRVVTGTGHSAVTLPPWTSSPEVNAKLVAKSEALADPDYEAIYGKELLLHAKTKAETHYIRGELEAKIVLLREALLPFADYHAFRRDSVKLSDYTFACKALEATK